MKKGSGRRKFLATIGKNLRYVIERMKTLGMIMDNLKRALIAILLVSAGVIGCAKMPEKLVSPTFKIEPVIKDNRELFKLTLNTGLQNENSDTAFLDMKGLIVFKDADKRILAIPFRLPVILPFDTGIIEAEKTCTESEIMPLVVLFGSDREKLMNDKVLDRSFIDEKNIGFELTGYEKKNILDLLKEKVNEKN